MHEGMEAHKTFRALMVFVVKYIRSLRSLKRVGPRAAHLLGDNAPPPPLETEGPDFDEQELMDRLLTTEDAEEQVEVLAIMRQSGFRPPTRAPGGPRRFVPRSGPARIGRAARFGAPPPRNRLTSLASIATARGTRPASANSRGLR